MYKLLILWNIFVMILSDDYDMQLENYKEKYKAIVRYNYKECLSEYLFTFLRNIDEDNDPKLFFCKEKFETNINNLPMNGKADNIPWSGYYWPIKFGGISVRYEDNIKNSQFEIDSKGKKLRVLTYKESVQVYSQPQEHNRIYNPNNIKEFENYVEKYYSPTEKYDLLIGDLKYTLTNSMKSEGLYMQKDKENDVPYWMGKCHGWAPASYMEKRPLKMVKILAADGITNISFFPDDIKALITTYWAESSFKSQFIGSRCRYENLKDVPKDNETGLWNDPTCFSINPASLTITLANQIGIRKKNLIYDPDSNGEIWNQPVFQYEMTYYNVLTNKVGDYLSSRVALEACEVTSNLFLAFIFKKASPNTKFVVGVRLSVDFIKETTPSHLDNSKDLTMNSQYKYILELSDTNDILGGEWTSNHHPIFIWTGENPNGIGDNSVGEFSGSVDDLRKLKAIALKASSKNTVLGQIVKHLIKLSNE